MKGFWSETEYDALRALAADHSLTAKDIMNRLNQRFRHGRTRNAILGAAHRIGVTIGHPNEGSRISQRVRQARHGPPKPAQRVLTMRDVGERLMRLPPPPEPPPPPVPPYSVADLTHRHCRWIDGDPQDPRPFACTETKEITVPYCELHMKRSFSRIPIRGGASSPLTMLHKRKPPEAVT